MTVLPAPPGYTHQLKPPVPAVPLVPGPNTRAGQHRFQKFREMAPVWKEQAIAKERELAKGAAPPTSLHAPALLRHRARTMSRNSATATAIEGRHKTVFLDELDREALARIGKCCAAEPTQSQPGQQHVRTINGIDGSGSGGGVGSRRRLENESGPLAGAIAEARARAHAAMLAASDLDPCTPLKSATLSRSCAPQPSPALSEVSAPRPRSLTLQNLKQFDMESPGNPAWGLNALEKEGMPASSGRWLLLLAPSLRTRIACSFSFPHSPSLPSHLRVCRDQGLAPHSPSAIRCPVWPVTVCLYCLGRKLATPPTCCDILPAPTTAVFASVRKSGQALRVARFRLKGCCVAVGVLVGTRCRWAAVHRRTEYAR
jgi:hypothetical protein